MYFYIILVICISRNNCSIIGKGGKYQQFKVVSFTHVPPLLLTIETLWNKHIFRKRYFWFSAIFTSIFLCIVIVYCIIQEKYLFMVLSFRDVFSYLLAVILICVQVGCCYSIHYLKRYWNRYFMRKTENISEYMDYTYYDTIQSHKL